MLLVTGCGGIVQVAPPVASVDQVQDLSVFKVQPEIKEIKPLPADPELKYVDTAFMSKLIKTSGVISNKRTAYEEYPPEWNFVLIDSRPPAKYQEGHIDGAINIPDADFEKLQHLLPQNKEMPLYFYCGGLDCKLSPNSAKKAMKLGYKNVFVYQEGEPFWTAAGNPLVVTHEYVANLLLDDYVNSTKNKPFVILDARPYSTYFAGHIPTAVFADDGLLTEKFLATMPRDKSVEIITYCGGFSCAKSHNAARALMAAGYTNVKVFAGGLPVWQAAKLPVIGAAGSKGGLDITGGKPNRKLTPTEFREKLAAGKNVVVLDVRTAEERSAGAIKGSIHIPDAEIKANPKAAAAKLPADKNVTILIHCATGARAAGVVDLVAEQGYPNTFYLNNRISIDANGNMSF